jgi:hypothetical protein
MSDPDFVTEMTRAGVTIEPVSGADMRRMLEQAYGLPPELIKRTRAALAN